MIASFRSKKLERYWFKGDARGLPKDQLNRLLVRLTALDNATRVEEMNVPGWYFHGLTGNMKGRYSVRVTGNWRLTFGWDSTGLNAVDVDYLDYH